MPIRGSCHCGNLSFTLAWPSETDAIPARACTCSFCTRHGGVWTAASDASIEVAIEDPSRVSRYAFGTRTAQFHVCATCGVVPVATSRIDGRTYAVVNVNTFGNVEPARLRRVPVSFDEETETDRLSRRQRAWIANVAFVERGG